MRPAWAWTEVFGNFSPLFTYFLQLARCEGLKLGLGVFLTWQRNLETKCRSVTAMETLQMAQLFALIIAGLGAVEAADSQGEGSRGCNRSGSSR